MKSKASGKITASQRRWQEAVRQLGSVISGGPAVIHHAVGITAKHNKVPIGAWWVIPLTDEEHKALHAGKEWLLDGLTRKQFEKHQFGRIMGFADVDDVVKQVYGITAEDLPPPKVVEAIMSYHR